MGDTIAQPHGDAGVTGVERGDQRGHQRGGDRRQRGDGDEPAAPARNVAGVEGDRGDLVEHALDDRQELAPYLGQDDRPGGAIQQAHAERLLQVADADGQRGLRHVQRPGGAGEIPQSGDPEERLELAQGEIHSGTI